LSPEKRLGVWDVGQKTGDERSRRAPRRRRQGGL